MRDLLRRVALIVRTGFQADPRLAARQTVLILGARFLPLAGAVVVRQLVDDAARGRLAGVVGWSIALAAASGTDFALWPLKYRLYVLAVERGSQRWNEEIMRSVTTAPGLDLYEVPAYHDELEMIRFQPTALGGTYPAFVTAASFVLFGLVSAVVLVLVEPGLVVLPLLVIPVAWLLNASERRNQAAFAESAEARRHGLHFFELATAPDAAAEVRVWDLGDELLARHHEVTADADARQIRAEVRAGLVGGAAQLLFTVGYVGAVAYVVERGIRGAASIGDVVLVVLLANAISAQLRMMMIGIGGSLQGLALVSRVLAIFRIATPLARAVALQPTPERLTRSIRLRDVGFRYAGADVDALAGVDLELPAGSVVALVGDNGAGKTTLVKLLTGMYQPTGGAITVDDIPLTELDVAAWRARTSGAFQDHVGFEFTLREAVGIGDLDRLDDDVAVLGALERAGAMTVVDDVPGGLDTQLGPSFPNGTHLSGGQWQKVALGRAMMRRQPLLLVLDEPTASLDPGAEQLLFERYASLSRESAVAAGTVTVLVSHRISSVRIADLIVVVAGGRVQEVGTHDELLALDGVYAELYQLQAAGYRGPTNQGDTA